MSHLRFTLKGKLVRDIRIEKGWSRKFLAKKTGIAGRKLCDIENDRGEYDHFTVQILAETLQVGFEALVYARNADWQNVPELRTRAERDKIAAALRLDMQGGRANHLAAARLCQEVLDDAPCSVAHRGYAEVAIEMAAMLDRAGEHQRALAACQALLDALPHALVHENRRTRYHRGICLRRLGRFAEAEQVFRELLACDDRAYQACIEHQLVVIDIQRAKAASDDHDRNRHLDAAMTHAVCALAIWDELGTRITQQQHRLGYTWQRIAEIHELSGNIDAAIEACTDALEWLSWYHCRRYVNECRTDLRRLLQKQKLAA